MAQGSVHTLYDVDPLLPLIEQGYILLTPNQRLARHIIAALDAAQLAAGRSSWRAPKVLAVETWLQHCWEQLVLAGRLPARRRLSAGQLSALWRRVVHDGDGLQPTLSLLQPAAAARLASDARDTLLHWRIDIGDRAVRQQFQLHADAAAFLAWNTALQARLDALGLASAADCLQALATAPQGDTGHRVVLVENGDLTPLQQVCLDALSTDIREHRAQPRQATVSSLVYPDERAELSAIARWCAEMHSKQPQGSFAVVLTDMRLRPTLDHFLRREFACFDAQYTRLPVNYSAGIGLDRAPLVRSARAILDLAGETMAVDRLLLVLNSQFIPFEDRDSPRMLRFIRRVMNLAVERLSTATLRYLASTDQETPDAREDNAQEEASELGERLVKMQRLFTPMRRMAPSAWAACFSEALTLWQWPRGIALDSLEYQQLQLWQEAMEDYRAFDMLLAPLDLDAALSLLGECCQERVFQPKTTQTAVQVLGPLEAAGLVLDGLWVAGVDAANWPASARANPLIPLPLQRARETPHSSPQREWDYAHSLLMRYRASAASLYLSYASERDGVAVLASPFMRDVPRLDAQPTARDETQWWPRTSPQRLETLQDDTAPPVSDSELADLRGGASLLANQSACPFRAFARQRMQVEPAVAVSGALTPAERGTMLHEALFSLWGRLGGSAALRALGQAERPLLLTEAVEAGVNSLGQLRRTIVGAGCLELERRRLLPLLDEWLETEACRVHPFTVSEREATRVVALGRLSLSLRMDRVDTLADGRQVIIDYKSGSTSIADWFGERPEQPQLPLYAVHADTLPAAIAFAKVRPRDCAFVGLGAAAFAEGVNTDIEKATRNRDNTATWSTLLTTWEQRLLALANDFLTGEARVDPRQPRSCDYCGLQSLCRIDSAPQT